MKLFIYKPLAQQLVTSTEGKTNCKQWGTDGFQGYGRVLPEEVEHYISKTLTQRLERNFRYCASTHRTLAPPTKQIEQGLEANRGNSETRPELQQNGFGSIRALELQLPSEQS
ncbi:MAG: hypothetical protein KME05_22195 [Gloeocapsa sp. UFS-A4-WI-NPMV-4B04]|jgi:hypothetical protein|nr:hypothetical protein [Gloeocapsa sp. UFS-A4-WI-NPMV-4B04]